ncbi:DUF4386 domain-containing protein [Pedobacter sp. Hv1]|uniref:DUF4386 domain-containing protein n=1 Tax=Pedobacter sp. Hv1 TaxID=1740090 RepID=UPI0006D8A7F4|nr:DUF4386 domain-containing protein [Pedobacter sp. Hv1]KQC02296.1 hypothetical protein AQF98_01590 [Pedobacter sp. Hv1]
MYSNKKTARIAGLLYLVVVLTGMFSLAYVPSKLIVWNNAAQTVSNITGSEFLFRLGMVSSLVCYTFFLFLPIVLYQLLKSVNKTHAKVMVILAIVSVPISFINLLNKFAVLSLISGSTLLKGAAIAQMQTQVMFYLDLYNSGILIVQIFWGLWLFPFGYLVFKSGFLPKFLGVLLMAGCFGYLLNFLGNFLLPNYGALGISSYVRLPASLGEIGTCLWLLIMGAKEKSNHLGNG